MQPSAANTKNKFITIKCIILMLETDIKRTERFAAPLLAAEFITAKM